MKKLPVENLSFVEIGGVGEMVYRAVRFPEYIPDYDEDGEIIKPLFTGSHAPESSTDYSLTGQELLVSLCNLYGKLNNPDSTVQITNAVWDCQAERNRRNRRASYARKKAAEAENKE